MISGGKEQLRELIIAIRKSQGDKDEISRTILDRVMELPLYVDSRVVMWYIDVRDEVRTRGSLVSALATDKTIVVPYCVDNELALFHLESLSELSPGKYGIMEPKGDLRKLDHKSISPDSLEVMLVPGVTFDIHGGRLGHGQGYYDRLMSKSNKNMVKIGIAYACQIVDEVPMDPHDVAMDMIVTETMVVSLL